MQTRLTPVPLGEASARPGAALPLNTLRASLFSTLYAINLGTGAAGLFNGTAPPSASAIAGTTGPVRGLALQLK